MQLPCQTIRVLDRVSRVEGIGQNRFDRRIAVCGIVGSAEPSRNFWLDPQDTVFSIYITMDVQHITRFLANA